MVPGAAAGALAAVAFAAVHALWITDIWFSLVAMMVAGAVCGATIAWSYGRLFEPSIRTWLGYNASFLVALTVLGLVSIAVFEPRTTMAEVLMGDGPPLDLIGAALPVTIAFTLGTAVVLSVLFGRTPAAFVAILATCAVLMVLLGLDVSVIGMIRIPMESLYLVVVMAGLIVVLAGSFAAVVIALAWGQFGARRDGHRDPGGRPRRDARDASVAVNRPSGHDAPGGANRAVRVAPERMTRRSRDPAARATDREVGVVAAIPVTGSEKAAARHLGLSHSTVKHHLANARCRVGVETTAQLVWILAPRLPKPEGAAIVSRRSQQKGAP